MIELINTASGVITSVLIPLAFALCLFYFFWGMVKYIWSEGTSKEEGRKFMIWGIVGLFVAFSIWGIIAFMKSELGIPDVQNPSTSK